MSKRNRERKANKREIHCKSAHYRVDGKDILIPITCLDCHQKGLVLAYDYKQSRMLAICSAREDAIGKPIKACEKVSFAMPMAKYEYDVIVNDPHTSDYFFYLKVLSM